MTDSPKTEVSSDHDSADESTAAQQAASGSRTSKDKECPYCHQHFTSSSLGRHLDQFITKKKPDGIHDVDEIRRMRGGITRRIARSSKKDKSAEHDDNGNGSSQASPAPGHASVPPPRLTASELNHAPPGGQRVHINRLNWHTTGVITDPTTLDSPIVASPSPAVLPSPSANKRSFAVYAQDLYQNSASENTRALELALREVLDSLRAATKHASPKPSPFPFDVQSQTFPSLCLKVLPPPATLFQTAPFSTLHSVPITPPGPDQLPVLRKKMTATIDHWKWQALRLSQPTTTNIAEEAEFLTHSAAEWTESTLRHLDNAFQNWMVHPVETRNLLWQVELLRAYNSEQHKVKETEERLERLQQEANHLQQQVEYLSRCQWPREMALWPPERRTFGESMREEVRLLNTKPPEDAPDGSTENINVGAGDKWNFDKLVTKWKAHVREDKIRRMPQSQTPVDGNHGGRGVAELKKTQSEPATEVNGLGNGQHPPPSTAVMEETRKSTRTQRPNVSIVSDY